MSIARSDSGHAAGQAGDLNRREPVHHLGAIPDLAIEVRPPALGGSLGVDRAGVLGSRGDRLHAGKIEHGHRRRAGGFRVITELTAGIVSPAPHGAGAP